LSPAERSAIPEHLARVVRAAFPQIVQDGIGFGPEVLRCAAIITTERRVAMQEDDP